MLSRLLSMVIVTFWLFMTGLLLRSELYPESSLFLSLPISHCLKLIFVNAQTSDLQISTDSKPVGTLRLLPSLERGSDRRLLDFMGRIQLPNAPKNPLSWRGRLEFSQGSDFERLRLNFNDSNGQRIDLLLDLPANQAQFRLFSGDQLLQEFETTLDQQGFQHLAELAGLDPSVLPVLGIQTAEPPKILAQQSSLLVRGEKIETYLLSLRHSGQTLCEVHLSQLGQVLKAKTFLGYQLQSEDL